VVAAGGVRTADSAIRMLVAGASRIGTSGAAAMAAMLGPSAPPLLRLLEPNLSPAGDGGPAPAASGY